MRRRWTSWWCPGWRMCAASGPGGGDQAGAAEPGRDRRPGRRDWRAARCRTGWPTRCSPARRAIRSSPSSWSPRRWPTRPGRRRGGANGGPDGAAGGERRDSRSGGAGSVGVGAVRAAGPAGGAAAGSGRAGAARAGRRCSPRCRWPAGRWTRRRCADVTGLGPAAVRRGLRELAAARLLAEPALVPAAGACGPGARWRGGRGEPAAARAAGRGGGRARCCPVSGRCCTSGRRRCWSRRAMTCWRPRRPATGSRRASRTGNCPPGWRRDGPPSGCSATPRRPRTSSGRSRCAATCPTSATCPPRVPRPGAGPPGSQPAGTGIPGLPGLYVRAVDALGIAGDSERAAILAEEAYSRFAGHPDPGTAAAVLMRAAEFRMRSQPQAALELLQEAIRLVSDGPPSAVQAEAWYRYGRVFLDDRRGEPGGQPDGLRTGGGDRRGGMARRLACPAQPGRPGRPRADPRRRQRRRSRCSTGHGSWPRRAGTAESILLAADSKSFAPMTPLAGRQRPLEAALAGLRAATPAWAAGQPAGRDPGHQRLRRCCRERTHRRGWSADRSPDERAARPPSRVPAPVPRRGRHAAR